MARELRRAARHPRCVKRRSRPRPGAPQPLPRGLRPELRRDRGGEDLYDAAGINRKTAVAYDRLLQNLLIVDELPPWSSNQLKRLVRSPRRHLIDPSLLVGILGLDSTTVMGDGDQLGRVLDTFVTAQIRAEAALSSEPTRLYHLRQEEGRHEIDLIIETGGRRLVGVEIKAGSAPTASDARHLSWLRDELGEDFAAGVVLHTGPASYPLGDRITAAPISTLWASASGGERAAAFGAAPGASVPDRGEWDRG